MGVLGMLAPEATGGLGLTGSTSCWCSRRPGRFALPEPIVETAACGRAAASAATDLTVGRGRRAACRGPTPPTSIFTARRPLRARRRSSSSPRPSVDGARRLFEVHGHAARRSTVADVARRVRPRRRRHRRAACGLAQTHARPDRRVREGAPPVRRADRLVPGGEAPPRQRPHRARVRPPARLPGRGVARRRRSRHARARVDGEGQGRRGRARRPRRPRCSATAPSATRPSTTCTST